MTKTTARKTTALATVMTASESVAAKMSASLQACMEMAELGFKLGCIENGIAEQANQVSAHFAGNRAHAKAWFYYGYVCAYLLARHYGPVLEAQAKDGLGVFGEALLAFGQLIVEQGASHGAKKIPAGKFERAEIEEKAWHAAYTRWRDLEFAALPAEKQAEIKAARKRKAGGATKQEAKKTAAKAVKITALPKPKSIKEAATTAYKAATGLNAFAKKAANDLPLAVKEAFAAAEIAAKAFLESVKDAE